MINTNIQINPGKSGVDFTRLRKYKSGGNIPKFQNPYSPLELNSIESGKNWRKSPGYLNESGQYDFEKMYAYYKAHPEEFGDLSTITATPKWEGAQRNTKGFKDWNTQFNTTGLNKFFGWDENVADYYGPTTSARRSFLNYINEKEAAAKQPEISIPSEVKSPEVPDENSTTENTYSPLEFPTFKRAKTPFTEPIHLAFNTANQLANNWKNYNLATKSKTPLLEAPYKQYEVTDDTYLGRKIADQQVADMRARVNANLTSDASFNRGQLLAAEEIAQKTAEQNALNSSRSITQNRQNARNIANENIANSIATANQNNQNNVVAYNNILNARQKLNTQNTDAINGFTNNLNNALQKYNQAERLENRAFNDRINSYMANRMISDSRNAYRDYYTKGIKGTVFDNWYNDWSKTSASLGSDWTGDSNDKEAVWEYLTSHSDSDYYKQLEKEYNNQLDRLYQKYMMNADEANSRLAYLKIAEPVQLSGQGLLWGDAKRARRSTPTNWLTAFPEYKRGGRVRFLQYLEHNREVLREVDKNATEQKRQSNQLLKRELDSLDRETLLLLRSIFK